MSYKRLFIWVEGEDDKRFFESILEPKLREKYDFVETRLSSKLKKEKIDNFIRSIKAMGADYIYVEDINNFPCITAKKQKIHHNLRSIENDKTIVVIKEIESWYLAGLKNTELEKFKMSAVGHTDDITKEKFNSLIPNEFDSRIDFMSEILKVYSIQTAKDKNRSFSYFVEKYKCGNYEGVASTE